MNCKPNELCRIVGMPHTPEANNHFVTTVCLVDEGYRLANGSVVVPIMDGPIWLVRGHNIPQRYMNGRFELVSERAIVDRCLRPIRDPGDEAQDESKSWLPPVPSSHKETA